MEEVDFFISMLKFLQIKSSPQLFLRNFYEMDFRATREDGAICLACFSHHSYGVTWTGQRNPARMLHFVR